MEWYGVAAEERAAGRQNHVLERKRIARAGKKGDPLALLLAHLVHNIRPEFID